MTTSLVSSSTTRVAPARGALHYIPTLAIGVDLTLVTGAVFAAIVGRQTIPFGPIDGVVKDQLGVAGPAMILGWIALVFLFGGYRVGVFGAGTDEYKSVVNASLTTAALVGIACYLVDFPLARGFFVLAFLCGVPLLLVGRFSLRTGLRRARRRGALQHRVLIAGAEGHVDEIASVLRRETWLGYQVIGAVVPDAGHDRMSTHFGIPLLGSPQSIAQVALDARADVVFLAGGAFDSASDLRNLAWQLEEEDVQLVIAPSVTDVTNERVKVRPVGGLPLLHLEPPRSERASRRTKRVFDIVVGTGLLVLAAPILLVACLRITIHDGGPVLARTTRIGRNGKAFRVWSLRTMVTGAEQLTAQLRAEQGYDGTALFPLEDDPRLTAPGRWIRRNAIDELPQLVSVVLGDMSLIGPRAPMSHEMAGARETTTRRLHVRPGLTGVWRDFRRSDLSWSEAVSLDLYYAENWSMIQDLTILIRTISAARSLAEGAAR